MKWACGKFGGRYIEGFAGNPKGKKLLLELSVEGSITLKWSLKKKDVSTWTEFIWLRLQSSGRIL